jgi:TonB family protein
MNTPRSLLFAALLLPAASGLAQFESARLAPDNDMPPYPPSLMMSGITRGYAVIATSIDTEGKVQDALVLSYTQPQLADTALRALRGWRFIPARLDGVPVPVQRELRIDFSLEGAVITANAMSHFFFDGFDGAGDMRPTGQLCPANRLDRMPVRVEGQAPEYAREANKGGVVGRVQVHFYIDERGEVRFAGVHPDPGVHPYLMERAVEAVQHWKFDPPTRNGQPVMVAAVQEFDFGSLP